MTLNNTLFPEIESYLDRSPNSRTKPSWESCEVGRSGHKS